MKRTHRNPDDSLRNLERMARRDPTLRPVLHTERFRRGLPFMPDEEHDGPRTPGERSVVRWETYYLTPERGVRVFYSSLCSRCRHPWTNHSDAESLEDEDVGSNEPCMEPGCNCADFSPGGHFVPIRRHEMVSGLEWHEQSFGDAVIVVGQGETLQDAVQRQLLNYYDNFRRLGDVSIWA